jgi:hypothetical protein
MKFDTFCASIKSPAVKAVALHWNAARGAQTMPSWNQLKPSQLAKELPLIWSYKFDPTTGQFTGRLAGDRISQIFGKNFRGIALEDVHPPAALGWVKELLMRVVSEPAIYRSSGRVFKQLDRYGVGERIILPLASDGVTGDGILGLTEYHYRQPSSTEPVHVVTEVEDWLSLSPNRSHR